MTLVARLQPKTGGEEARRRHEAFIKSKGWQTATKAVSDLPTLMNVKGVSDHLAKVGAKQTAVIALRKRTSIAIVCHKEESGSVRVRAPYVASFSKPKNKRGAASPVRPYTKLRAIATPERITQLQDEPGKDVEDNEASFNPDAAATRTHSAEARYRRRS
ncbi:hypothetical protein LTR50_006588 [Elasticomyces elasticus]|nr:hypothetical protein LTR50_006588 [Elasticomyces elasticus]